MEPRFITEKDCLFTIVLLNGVVLAHSVAQIGAKEKDMEGRAADSRRQS